MKTIKRHFGHIEQYIAVLVLTVMLCTLTYNTVARYLFHVTLPWAEEMCAYGQIWLVYIAVSYGVREKAHICIDSVIGLYPKRLKGIILLLGLVAWLIFGIIMTGVGFRYMMDTMQKGGRAISVAVPLWIVYLSIPVGHFFLCIRLIQQIVKCIQCVIQGKDPADFLVDNSVDGIDLNSGELELSDNEEDIEEGGEA